MNCSAIQVSWTIPSSLCYRFDQFLVQCSPQDGGKAHETMVENPEMTEAVVGGLESDTRYTCNVTSTLGTDGGTFDHMTVSEEASTFTYPDRKLESSQSLG